MKNIRKRALALSLWVCMLLMGLVCVQAAVTYAASDMEDGVAVNETNFPDEVFRAHAAWYDTDKDGILSEAELQAVTKNKDKC